MNGVKIVKRIANLKYQPTLSLLSVLVLWWLVTVIADMPKFVLPSPISVISALIRYFGPIMTAMGMTLYEALAGFALSIAIGIPLGIFVVYSGFTRAYILPLLVMTNSIPKSALAPLFLLWAGYGAMSKILISFLMAFFPIVINTAVGLYQIDQNKIDLIRSLQGTQWQIFSKVRFPNALPAVFAGLKMAITLSLIGAVVGEFVGGNKGIGVMILSATTEINTSVVFSCIIVLSIIGIGLFYGVEYTQKIWIPWYKPEKIQT